MQRDSRFNWVAAVGVVLIVAGAWSLLHEVFGPAFAPLAALLHWTAIVTWPVALIAVGVLILTRGGSRARVEFGGLTRSRSDRVVGGVIGGVAKRIGMDSTIARILFVLLTMATSFGAGVLLYLAGLVFIPEESWGASSAGAPPAAPVPPAPPIPTAAPSSNAATTQARA